MLNLPWKLLSWVLAKMQQKYILGSERCFRNAWVHLCPGDKFRQGCPPTLGPGVQGGSSPCSWHFNDFMSRVEVVRREKIVVCISLFDSIKPVFSHDSIIFPIFESAVTPLQAAWALVPSICPVGRFVSTPGAWRGLHFTKINRTRVLMW